MNRPYSTYLCHSHHTTFTDDITQLHYAKYLVTKSTNITATVAVAAFCTNKQIQNRYNSVLMSSAVYITDVDNKHLTKWNTGNV